jgi:anthranilate synthase component 1
MGSSPESQLIIQNHKAIIHPIAGTFRRTGDTEKDLQSVETLKKIQRKRRTYDVG